MNQSTINKRIESLITMWLRLPEKRRQEIRRTNKSLYLLLDSLQDAAIKSVFEKI